MKHRTFFLGEMLMRLECPDHLRFAQTEHFLNRYTGAELNSAVAMHHLGSENLYLITSVPDNELGDAALNEAAKWGVSTRYSLRKPGRLGLFFLEQGFGARPSSVIYDRKDSVFANARYEDFGFEQIFKEGDWLYVSGTMPALTPAMPEFLHKVFQCAKQKKCIICFDLNYRAALWSWNTAKETFLSLMPHIDILFGNVDLVRAMFQVEPERVCTQFSLKLAALTKRMELDATKNICSASLYDAQGNAYHSKEYTAVMLDRIGGGDAFSGAVMHAFQKQIPLQETADFAIAVQILKQTIRGDFSLVKTEEVRHFLAGNKISVRR